MLKRAGSGYLAKPKSGSSLGPNAPEGRRHARVGNDGGGCPLAGKGQDRSAGGWGPRWVGQKPMGWPEMAGILPERSADRDGGSVSRVRRTAVQETTNEGQKSSAAAR